MVVRLLVVSNTSGTRRALQTLSDELPGRLRSIDLQCEPTQQAAARLLANSTGTPHALITALGAFLRKAPQRPWAAQLQQLRISDDLEVTPAVARAALAGLPGLQELQITVWADAGSSSRSAAQQEVLAQFPPALEALVLRGWHVSVDAAGLTATCPGLRKLQLQIPGSRGLVNVGSLGSLPQLQRLELDLVTEDEPTSISAEEEALLQALLLAASQLPHLHTLKAPGAAVGPAEWQLLAGMPALQQAHLGRLGLLGAAALPAVGLVQLEVEDLHLECWEAGALAALLPQLEELEIRNGTTSVLRLCKALQGHSRLRRLAHWPGFDDDGLGLDDDHEATWPAGQPLQSMPQLQSVIISTYRWYRSMDGLLADAAGCAGLQELYVALGWDGDLEQVEDEPLEPFWATASGLAAVAAGPCSSTLQKLRLEYSRYKANIDAAIQTPALSPAEVAALLRGAFPQLQELSVEVRLGGAGGPPGPRPTGYAGGSSAASAGGSGGAVAEVSEAQVDACLARAAAAAAGGGVHLPRWQQCAAADLVRALLQQGVQGLAGFALGPPIAGSGDGFNPWIEAEGSVGRCQVRCTIWPQCACEW